MYPQLKFDTPKTTKYCKIDPVPTFIKKKAKRLSRKTNDVVTVDVIGASYHDRNITISCTKDGNKEEYCYYFSTITITSYVGGFECKFKRVRSLSKTKTSNIFKVGTDVPTHIWERDYYHKNFKLKNKNYHYKRIKEKLTDDENIYDKSLTLYKFTKYSEGVLDSIYISGYDTHLSCCIFNENSGHLTFLTHDGVYALTYSQSLNNYIAGCRVFTREEAMKHWGRVSQSTDMYVSDKRRNRAKIFLEAINNHTP